MEDQMNMEMELIRKEFEDYENGKLEGDNPKYEKLLEMLITMARKVESSHKFSDNEEFEEIKIEDLKFLLVRYYQGVIIQKFYENRASKLEIAKQFFDEFFKILRTYSYLSKEKIEQYKNFKGQDNEESDSKNTKPNFQALSQNREEKIKNAKYKKDLSDKLSVK